MKKKRNEAADEESAVAERTSALLKSYPRGRRSLVPILQEVQGAFGYLPRGAMLEVARFVGVHEAVVYGVATFYSQFRLTPPGKHVIKVCLGTACHIKGGTLIQEAWERKLDIGVGGVTDDRELGLERVACVGCCAMAPVVVADDTVYGQVRPTKVEGILVDLSAKNDKEEDDLRGDTRQSAQAEGGGGG